MAIAKWDPFREFNALQRQFHSLLDDFPQLRNEVGRAQSPALAFNVDISENPEAYVIHADLPGFKKEDIDVTVDNGILTVQGHRTTVNEEKKDNYHRIERSSGTFRRSFQLPDLVDAKAIVASYTEGVLEVKLPKTQKPEARGHKVQVA